MNEVQQIEQYQDLQKIVVSSNLFSKIVELSDNIIVNQWQLGYFIRALIDEISTKAPDVDNSSIRALVYELLKEHTGKDESLLYKYESIGVRVPLTAWLFFKFPLGIWEAIFSLPWWQRLSVIHELYEEQQAGKSITVEYVRSLVRELKSGDEEEGIEKITKTFKLRGDVSVADGVPTMFTDIGSVNLDALIKALVPGKKITISITLKGDEESNLQVLANLLQLLGGEVA